MIATSGPVEYKQTNPLRLVDPWSCKVPIKTAARLDDPSGGDPWVSLLDGVLSFRDGYAWAPRSKDRKRQSEVRASLIYDGISQLVKTRHLPDWAEVVAREMYRDPPIGKTHIVYQRGFKYQTTKEWSIQTKTLGYGVAIEASSGGAPWVSLTPRGVLTIREGFCWDGPSGPTVDTPEFIAASLPHDGGFDLMRNELIPRSTKSQWDALLRDYGRQLGMGWFRTLYVWIGVKIGADFAAKPGGGFRIEVAP